MGKKTTRAERDARVSKVFELLLSGARRKDILQYSTKQGWNVSSRAVDGYIARATDAILDYNETDREQHRAKSLARLEMLIARNMQIQDFKAALQVVKEINAIAGIYAPKESRIELIPGVSPELLIDLAAAISARDMSASAIFEAMLHEISERPVTHE